MQIEQLALQHTCPAGHVVSPHAGPLGAAEDDGGVGFGVLGDSRGTFLVEGVELVHAAKVNADAKQILVILIAATVLR